MPEQLPRRQYQPLRRGIHRHVRGMLDDVEALEVNPHRVSGVCDSPVSIRVRGKQVAVLVVPVRVHNSEYWDEHDTDDHYPGSHGKYSKSSTPSQVAEGAFEGLKCCRT